MIERTWSTKIIRSSVAVTTPNIDFTGLHDFGALVVYVLGLAYSDAEPAPDPDVLVQVSHDGVVWDTVAANYVIPNYVSTGNGWQMTTTLDRVVNWGGRFSFVHFNEDRSTWMRWRGGRKDSASGQRQFWGVHRTPKRLSGIRITNSLGYNWTTNLGVQVRERQWA